jgi:lipid A ethanolaminephosphotransferase
MGTYNVVIDSTMMTNVLQTDMRETRDLLSLRMAASVLVIAVLPLAWLWRRPLQSPGLWRQAGRNLLGLIAAVVVMVVVAGALFADLASTMRTHNTLRYKINPLNSFYALGMLVHDANARPAGPPVAIGADVALAPPAHGAKPLLLALVVGETARADHFALNGYERATTPGLAAQGVVSFSNVTSCGTSTATSLPCMFSHLGKQAYESRDQDYENLLDVLQRAGLAVLWLDNQAGCKGLCERVPHDDAYRLAAGAAPMPAGLCDGGECLDEALLHGLDQRLAALPAERRARGVVLVLHQMGSHGPAYSKRSPPGRKPFVPECTTNVLQQCERQQLLNAYDNSIAYTDSVLAQAIAWLGRQSAGYDPALLYLSDHGESLGENNLYLHGLPYGIAPREQKHVPMVVWLAPQTEAATGIAMQCLQKQRDVALSHDNLVPSVLGLVRAKTSVYRGELDVFSRCR